MTTADHSLPSPEPQKVSPPHDVDWVIWSNDHGAWWGPNRCGYSPDLLDAGVYTEHDAKKIEATSSPRAGSTLPQGAVADVAKSLRGLMAIAARSKGNVASRLYAVYASHPEPSNGR